MGPWYLYAESKEPDYRSTSESGETEGRQHTQDVRAMVFELFFTILQLRKVQRFFLIHFTNEEACQIS